MNNSGTFKVTAPGEREIVMTRVFDVPRALVFDAFTQPPLIQRWLLGPDGWTMPVCEVDPKVGGAYRYVWRREADGTEMGMGGVFREVVVPERIVHSEKFDQPWYPGEAVVTTAFEEQAGRTTVSMSILYDSLQTRDMVLKSGMERGVAVSYDRLEAILASSAAR